MERGGQSGPGWVEDRRKVRGAPGAVREERVGDGNARLVRREGQLVAGVWR